MFAQLTVGKKIVGGFSLVLLLLVSIGGISRFALNQASEGFTRYRDMARDSNLAGNVQANLIKARFHVKDFILTKNPEDLKKFEERWVKLLAFSGEAKKEITDPENAKRIDEIAANINNYRQGFDKLVQLQEQGEKLFAELNANGPVMEKALTEILISARDAGNFEVAASAGLAIRDMLLGRFYGTKYHEVFEIKHAEQAHRQFGKMQELLGEIDRQIQDGESRKRLATVSEVKSQYLKTLDGMIQAFSERNKIIEDTLNRIGPMIDKDTEVVKLALISQQNDLGSKLRVSISRSVAQVLFIGMAALIIGILSAFFITRGVTRPVRRVVDGLNESAEQIASASEQVSSASQQLAEGASEQAASVEETSSSLEEMSSMTKQNAGNAGQADSLMKQANQAVNIANVSMNQLMTSMQEISKASDETSKIIKTIDEIAFQTNLLALNAAVEAARAGEAGAGFAVVADEVRNLAMRAAEAAKNTAALIAGTVKKVLDGTALVKTTNNAFKEVAASAAKVGELIGEIAAASSEQAQGIEQVNIAVTEMDKVTQQNAANAEESASASEELNAQAAEMKSFVADLVAMVGGNGATSNGSRQKIAAYARSTQNKALAVLQLPAKKSLVAVHRSNEVNPNEIIHMDEREFRDF